MSFPGSYDPTATQVAAGKIASRMKSSKLWRHVNPMAMQSDPALGKYFIDDNETLAQDFVIATAAAPLVSGPKGVSAKTDADGALVRTTGLLGAVGTVCDMDSETTTATEGIQIIYGGNSFTPTAGYDIIFEARVCGGSATLGEYFMGMTSLAPGSEIIASGATATQDYIGFYSLAAGAVIFGVSDGSTESVTASAVHTLVNYNTDSDGLHWVKLGCILKGTSGLHEYYVNGVKGTLSTTATLAPDTAVSPALVSQSDGTTTGNLYVDWVASAQVAVN